MGSEADTGNGTQRPRRERKISLLASRAMKKTFNVDMPGPSESRRKKSPTPPAQIDTTGSSSSRYREASASSSTSTSSKSSAQSSWSQASSGGKIGRVASTNSARLHGHYTEVGGSAISSSQSQDTQTPQKSQGRSLRNSHQSPPNSWLSRSASKTFGRSRSSSVGSGDVSPSSSTGLGATDQRSTFSRSSQPASGTGSISSTSQVRPRSGTWSRIIAARDSHYSVEQMDPSSMRPTSDLSMRTPRSSVINPHLETWSGPATIPPSPKPEDNDPQQSNRRSLFTRAPTPAADCQGLQPPSDPPKKEGSVLRRMGSRTILGSNRGSKEPNTSQDSFQSGHSPTTSGNESGPPTPGLARRASNAFDKAIPGWLKEKAPSRKESDSSSSTPQGWTDTDEDVRTVARPSADSLRSRASESLPPRDTRLQPPAPRAASNSHLLPMPDQDAQDAQDMEVLATDGGDAALPKRLSGWLLNMLGNETSGSEGKDAPGGREPSQARLQAKAPVVAENDLAKKASIASMAGGGPRGKNTGLLASFSSSARARAAAAAGVTSSSAAVDRGSRQLSDGNVEEDIWLLGTKHSPAADRKLDLSAAAMPSESRSVRGASPATTHSVENGPDPRQAARHESSRHASSSSTGSKEAITAETARDTASDPRQRGTASPDSDRPESVISQSSGVRTASKSAPPSSAPLPAAPRNGVAASTWQMDFQNDFSSRIWCTYRNYFVPIARDGTISKDAEQAAALAAAVACQVDPNAATPPPSSASSRANTPANPSKGWLGKRVGDGGPSGEGSGNSSPLGAAGHNSSAPSPNGSNTAMSLGEKMGFPNLWGRATAVAQAAGLTGRAGLTTDAGWGCMLRTGQSLLANALIDVHLGRHWRRIAPPLPASHAPIDEAEREIWTAERSRYATYVRILSWFLDEPSTACPFGVHRMAREGKRLGKEVGEWFGPSTAAGAVKKLVDDFADSGLGVYIASDGVVYLSEVRNVATEDHARQMRASSPRWRRPVLVLVGLRLGLEGVHPMYHESVKHLFTFPQSVGIAGGRPSSSYYFVGFQGDSLFYLDPHHVRPAITFRHPPPAVMSATSNADAAALPQAGVDSSDAAEEWWAHIYSEQELGTFHCDRPKRMPMRSLDPSMLLGFLVRDEDALSDLTARVKALPKAIFSVQDELPRWMRDDGDDFGESGDEADPSLESFSESSYAEEGASDDDGDDEDVRSGADSIIENRSHDNEDAATQMGHANPVSRTRAHSPGHQESAHTATVPDIQISSSSRSDLIGQSYPVPSQETVSQLPRRLQQPQVDSPSGPSEEGLGMVRSPRYRSDLRFPSSASTATARHSSNGSTARQPSDDFVHGSAQAQGRPSVGDEGRSSSEDNQVQTAVPTEPSHYPPSRVVSAGRAIHAPAAASKDRRPSVVAISSSWEEVAPDSMQARATRESSVSQEWQDTSVEETAETPISDSFAAGQLPSASAGDSQRTDTPWSVLSAMRYNNAGSQSGQAPQRTPPTSSTQIPQPQARSVDAEEPSPSQSHSKEDIDLEWSPSSPSFDGLEAPSFPNKR